MHKRLMVATLLLVGLRSDRFDDYAVASGGYSVAIGTAAKADGGAGVSIGYKTNAKTY